MTFQRESRIGKINFSPFGKFNLDSFEMAKRGGFKNGLQISVKSVNSKIALAKLLKRELRADFLNIDGIELNLDYSSKKKFDHLSFFSNVKYLFINKSAKQGLIKNIEITNIIFSSGTLKLKLDGGEFVFSDIVLRSSRFDVFGEFSGNISFKISFKKILTDVSFDFTYDKENSVIKINNLVCADYGAYGDGKILLLDDGSVSLEYAVKINKGKYFDIMGVVVGADFSSPLFQSGLADDIIIAYPSTQNSAAQ
jgi:hypothetical protein